MTHDSTKYEATLTVSTAVIIGGIRFPPGTYTFFARADQEALYMKQPKGAQ